MAKKHIPRLCRAKSTARPYVTDPRTGKQVYLGAVGSWPTATKLPPWVVQVAYDAWLGKFLQTRANPPSPGTLDPRGLTVAALLNAYHKFAVGYYRRADGTLTSEPANIAHAIEQALQVHAATLAVEFGPLALKQVRARMEGRGWSRGFINDQVDRIRRAFRWGVENELVGSSAYDALKAVKSLAKGRTKAPDPEPVRPVPMAVIDATLPHLSPKFAAMVRVHLAMGCRAEEVVSMVPGEIDRGTTPWTYRPSQHKTLHREIVREIYVGPTAREILERWAVWTAPDRPIWPGRGRGPHSRYRGPVTVSGYAHAIRRAAKLAGVPHWSPRQLRKTQLTLVRHGHERGLEAAQAVAGHAHSDVTERYAQASRELGKDAAERFG